MYHRSLKILIYARDKQLEDILKKVEPLKNFSHDLTTLNQINEKEIKKSSVVILDHFPDNENLKKIYELKNENTLLIACVDKNNLLAVSQNYSLFDHIWTKPLTKEKIQFLFEKIQTSIKGQEDFSLTQKYLDALIDSLPDLIWFKDIKGEHLKVNNSFCNTVQKTKEDVQGRGHYYIWDIEPDEYAKGEYVCLETEEIVLREKRTCLFDETVKCKDEMRQFKTYKSPVFDDDGEVIGTVGIARDVTDLQNLQIEMNILFESLPFAVIGTDKSRNITSINKRSLNLFSLKKDDLIGKEIDSLWEKPIYNPPNQLWRIEKRDDGLYIFSKKKILKIQNEKLLDVFGEFSGYLFLFLDVTLEHRYKNKLIEDANTDYLTNLNNRRRLHDFLRKTPCKCGTSLFLADLDNFKQINDRYGHDEGDKILIAFSELLLRLFPAENLFRLGGDEFAIILVDSEESESTKAETAQAYAEKLISEFNEYVFKNFHHTEITVSIGIAIYSDGTEDFGSLFKKADIALYDSKCSGKNTFTFWHKNSL